VPIEDPADFSRAVWALPSRAGEDELLAHWAEGEALPGDLFVLASDALAHWLLAEYRRGGQPWRKLLSVEDDAGFAGLVAGLREVKALENDDTTALLVQLNASP
jgi:hypothetical protein